MTGTCVNCNTSETELVEDNKCVNCADGTGADTGMGTGDDMGTAGGGESTLSGTEEAMPNTDGSDTASTDENTEGNTL